MIAPNFGLAKSRGYVRLAKASILFILFEAITGLAITLLPFHVALEWTVLVHTAAGIVVLAPVLWYCAVHWLEYRSHPLSHIVLLGYVAVAALAVCLISGFVVAWQGLFDLRSIALWRKIHLLSTIGLLGTLLPHAFFAFLRVWQDPSTRGAIGRFVRQSLAGALASVLLIAAAFLAYSSQRYSLEFPKDYHFLYGTNRPFAPSLATTDTGKPIASTALSGSLSCGTAGCHQQILAEWKPSAHRYAAMDTLFQGIQDVMAKQNGPESTRYCGGCHDPISLFSATKNIFAKHLTALEGYQEGVSCLSCHAIRETDIKGNANYIVSQPREYLWQWQTNGVAKVARDFLIRTYPAEHQKLNKRLYKKPEYCAACHKQFIDQEVNRVGWVQLQNQYDNWSASHWNHKGDARTTVECRECHMPLVESSDPASGDDSDYNRAPSDGKHRSHRFAASNKLIPQVLQLEGWQKHCLAVDQWLQGKTAIPEIQQKWANGPIVKVALSAPLEINSGEDIPVRVILGSNKVGHDYPTGPLDIIQSWIELKVTDQAGRLIFSSGKKDDKNFIERGTFMFKAEPVDQYGNLIDRHNLWEMVGVRYRRALFPGYSDTVSFQIPCAGSSNDPLLSGSKTNTAETVQVPSLKAPGEYRIHAALKYRKVDQYLLNFLFGATNQLTSPITEIAQAEATVRVKASKKQASLRGSTPKLVAAP